MAGGVKWNCSSREPSGSISTSNVVLYVCFYEVLKIVQHENISCLYVAFCTYHIVWELADGLTHFWSHDCFVVFFRSAVVRLNRDRLMYIYI